MKRTINKIAVLGSGIMGSRIACHFANVGVQVLLLDVVYKHITAVGNKNDTRFRNKIVFDNLQKAITTKPLAYYLPTINNLITIGNLDDDLHKIDSCDWILEAIIEDLNIKKTLFKEVAKYRKPGTIITTNTSGIPIHLMLTGQSEDFKAHFCGTHFFNPPRYLPLLEIIPTNYTSPLIIDFLTHYSQIFLGKTTVLCKNTPAFIANRIGVYSIFNIWHTANKLNLNIAQVDALSGALLGMPKSATYRLSDIVGLDTLVKVANYLAKNLQFDESVNTFTLPIYIKKMLDNNWLGNKTGQGFYKRIKSKDGKVDVLLINLKTFEYEKQQKIKWDDIDDLRKIENLPQRLKAFYNNNGKAGRFFKICFGQLFAYCANRIPEIAEDFYQIDDAMRAGFGWQLGPFQIWDALSLNTGINLIEEQERNLAPWVSQMLNAGNYTFYKTINGTSHFYHLGSNSYKIIPQRDKIIDLDNLRSTKTLFINAATTIIDLGDGVINLEFNSKLNIINIDVLEGLNEAIKLAETRYKALVIANQASNFSAGADLSLILQLAQMQDWEGLNRFIKLFQNTTLRIKYAAIPIVVATQGLVLGGACEICLHASFVQLHAETYMGLVECGVGLLPAGGGCKAFAELAANDFRNNPLESNILKKRFLTITSSKVSTSALEAVEMGFVKAGAYAISLNKNTLIFDAKQKALELSKHYTAPQPSSIKVLGNATLCAFYTHCNSQKAAGFITEYDDLIYKKLAYVLCGGNLSAPSFVTEQYLLKLEREAFLSLCADERTQHKIAKIVKSTAN